MFTTESENYIELLRKLPPRPIKSEEELLAVQDVIDSLLDSDCLAPDEQDYLNVLGMLVYEYEENNIEIQDLNGADLLKALIKEFEVKKKDLGSIFKPESKIEEILSGEQKLTLEQIESLANFFSISPAAFFASKR